MPTRLAGSDASGYNGIQMGNEVEEWGLFPRPRTIERTTGTFETPPDAYRWRAEPGLGSDAYEIDVSEAGVEIRHADENARRYALQTLNQVRRACGGALPGMRVRDRPDFPTRGYMLDVSRDRVPTRETLERIVGLLARVRINHLQLYTEHTFAYDPHEIVWREASPITADDVRWLDALCAAHGIELCPNQNSFGHMERWLKHDAYGHLAEAPEGWETRWGRRQPPGVLAPTDESLAFVRGLFDELLPAFASRRVNVNCDETFELGQGRSRAEVERRGRAAVYVDFLNRILADLHARGRDVLFWGDIVRDHPDLLGDLPRRSTTALVWHYEAPTDPAALPGELFEVLGDFGIRPETMRGFVGHVPPFADAGLPFWVCPGTSSWNSLLGRLPNARGNLLDAAEQGLAHGASGYLITDWGDNGHLQPPTVSFPPIAYGGAVAWCVEANRDVETAAFLDREVFDDASGRLAGALEAAGCLYATTGAEPMNGSVLHYQLLGGGLSFLARMAGAPTEDGLRAVVETLDDLIDVFGSAGPRCADAGVIARELVAAARLARHGAWRSARQGGFEAPAVDVLRADLAEAIELQRAAWLERSREGGLRDSLARLEGTLAEYEAPPA